MNQLNLFEPEENIKPVFSGETKTCRNCNIEKQIDEFPFFSTVDAGRKNTCKSCNQKLAEIRKHLKIKYPPPPSGNCPICDKHTTSWVLDHCHFTDTFRGYICNNCNLGLGRFNDDVKLLQKAIDYLNLEKKLE
jgi:hypothetical protein